MQAQTPSPYLSILHQYFGYTSFRGIQQEIIESIGAGHDTLGLMPTGGGKSITFQVPALAKDGLCLVISPLIALMKDQVEHLRELGIKAAAVYTGMTRDEVIVALENCIFGNYKFLYVSPERLGSELFQAKVRRMKVSFICVDEAHCISQWGYDFRPSYLEIVRIRELLPSCPVLALTATATPAVVEDIQRVLRFAKPCVKQMSFERSNITYSVRPMLQTCEAELLNLLDDYEGCAIVYTRSRRSTFELAQWLSSQGISATHYHAGLTSKERSQRQAAWQAGEVRVMVATNAFGMGIDKPDVRLVVHTDVPDSPEAYFQEAGRAGRDGQPAMAVLLYNNHSVGLLRRRVEDTYPPVEYVQQVYEDLCYFLQMAIGDGEGVTRQFDIMRFCVNFKHFPVRAYSAITLLDRAGYIEWRDAEDSHSRIMMSCTRDELYTYSFSPQAERVLWQLLRTYTGIFSEYAYINEDMLADGLKMRVQDLNECLIELSRKHVIHFIPRSDIPAITFTQRRLERNEIVLPPAIYTDRKTQLAKRVETMIEYLTTSECHSRFLLRYFGEDKAQPCERCESCRDAAGGSGKSILDDKEAAQQLRLSIISYLREHGPTPLHSFHIRGVDNRVTMDMVHLMILNEELYYKDGLPIIAIRT